MTNQDLDQIEEFLLYLQQVLAELDEELRKIDERHAAEGFPWNQNKEKVVHISNE